MNNNDENTVNSVNVMIRNQTNRSHDGEQQKTRYISISGLEDLRSSSPVRHRTEDLQIGKKNMQKVNFRWIKFIINWLTIYLVISSKSINTI